MLHATDLLRSKTYVYRNMARHFKLAAAKANADSMQDWHLRIQPLPEQISVSSPTHHHRHRGVNDVTCVGEIDTSKMHITLLTVM